MRSWPAAAAVVTLGLAVLLGACGGAGADTIGAAPTVRKARARDSWPPPRAGERCRHQLQGFLAGMARLRRRLAVGLSYEDYLAAVRGARADHAEIAARRLGLGCLARAGAPAERALNKYIAAVNTWGDCLSTASCAPGSVEPQLQRAWERASHLLSAAQRGIQRLGSSQSS